MGDCSVAKHPALHVEAKVTGLPEMTLKIAVPVSQINFQTLTTMALNVKHKSIFVALNLQLVTDS